MTLNPFATVAEKIDLSPTVSDEVKTTTCYMCACRCGIKVHLRDGRIRYIEGNRDHPVNHGVLCAKGSAGIMNHYSPARLTTPLLRVGPRGAGEFKEIGWDEAMAIAVEWLGNIRRTDPRKLAFFTGRDQSQALTGWWAAQFGTPNYAAHGGFCSVNMAAAGIYTIGGSFWEFGEPDWERTRYLLMFGVAEDHDSNPIKIGLGQLKGRPADRRAKFVSVNPIRTGYSAIADEWIGIRPGTDGMFVLALVHELLRADKIDLDFLARYTNAPWLVVQDAGGATDGLIARDGAGHPLCWDRQRGQAVDALLPDVAPAMVGEFALSDGRRAVPVFQLIAQRYLDARYSPDEAAKVTGVPAATIRRIAAELAHAAFEQQIELRDSLDRLGGAPARAHDRTARQHACHARHLRPFERIPHLPRHPPAADPARQHRLPRRLALQAAVPAPHAAGAQAGRQARRREAEHAAAGAAAGLPDRTRRPADRGRRHAGADRQGVLVGGADRRARHDAYGHRQRPQGRSLPDRHAVPVHGEHELELGDEHRRDHGAC